MVVLCTLELIKYTVSNVALIQNELLYYQQLPNHFAIYPIIDAFTMTSNKNELLLVTKDLGFELVYFM
jgi:hypothetical protein